MILFSDSVEGLQRELNALHECSKSWDLTVNIKKTKIVIFRRSVTINENERFYIGECDLEIVDSFNYLGLCFLTDLICHSSVHKRHLSANISYTYVNK